MKKNILFVGNDLDIISHINQWLQPTANVHVTENIVTDQIVFPPSHVLMEEGARERKTESQLWDLVIIDLQLMEKKTLDVIQLIKSRYPSTAVLVISGSQQIEEAALTLQGYHHADGILFKPLISAKFIELTTKLLDDAKCRQEKEQRSILAIGAHPDDIEIACGGILARHQAAGAKINILTLSMGEHGGDKKARAMESELAAEMLKAQLFLADLPDTCITDGVETIRLIENIIAKTNPTHIYTHSYHDTHQDHRNAYLATVTAARAVTNFYCYQSPSCTIDFKPNQFINISEYMPLKLKILENYKSQIGCRRYMQEDMIRANALYWGHFVNNNYVEPIEVIREQY